MGIFMQVTIFKRWLLLLACWLADVAGGEIVQPGWRQIPDGHRSFDPALAEYFKSLNMRNGMHITLAVGYSVIVKWNRSNKKNGKDVRTYGDDKYYAKHYAEHVAGKTWGRHMDELAALGLILVSAKDGKPAYEAVPYQIVNNALMTVAGHDVSAKGHDVQARGHEEPERVHDDPPIIESFKKELSKTGSMDKPAPLPARAAEIQNQPDSKKVVVPNLMPPVKTDIIQKSPLPTVKPITPKVPQNTPVDWLAEECPESPEDLKNFFTFKQGELELFIATYGVERIRGMIEHVRGLPNVDSYPAMVIYKLRLGAQPALSWPRHMADDPKRYIEGKYADFIEH